MLKAQPNIFSQRHALSGSLATLFALYQSRQTTNNAKKNECGGILAFVSTADTPEADAHKFVADNAHFLQRKPY